MIDWKKDVARIERGAKKLIDTGSSSEQATAFSMREYLNLSAVMRNERDHYYAAHQKGFHDYNNLANSFQKLEASYEPLKRERDELLADVRSQGILTAIEK